MQMLRIVRKVDWVFVAIFVLAVSVRLYGFNWDRGFHFHPDERMLMMVTERVRFFSQLDPNFFNYGHLPIYLLSLLGHISAWFTKEAPNYENLLYLGRYFSAATDLLVLIVLSRLTILLFREKVFVYCAVFVYATAFFPIQNSHFFIVDPFLNLFALLLCYQLVLILRTSRRFTWRLIGISFTVAALLATKITGLLFLPVVFIVLFLKFSKKLGRYITYSALFVLLMGLAFTLFMPFALIRSADFYRDITFQLEMNSNPFKFPYTLQYVATFPYLYHLRNIFFWGFGPLQSLLAIGGLFLLSKKHLRLKNLHLIVLFLASYGLYFFIIGKSAVKFMRYMLPLYPILAILAGYFLYFVFLRFNKLYFASLVVVILLWLGMFISIYQQEHVRIAATNWINTNIIKDKTLAVEHWDDRIPIYGNYKILELAIYDLPDDDIKWQRINSSLKQVDYIVIASNRLYAPLQKLTNCSIYGNYCYKNAGRYYQDLFTGKINFKKIAEFQVKPALDIFGFKLILDDQEADESFTVYDHPKIMIFKNLH